MPVSEESREPNLLLKKARMERLWTQRHVAFELNIDIKTVATWENGKRFPSLEMRAKLCQLYGKSPEELGLIKVSEQEELSQASVKQEKLKQHVAISTTATALLPVVEDQVVKEEMNEAEKEESQDTPPWIEKIVVSPIMAVSHQDVNRQRMLTRVHTFWIGGIFERSLYQRNLLVLSLREQPDAILNPWREALQEALLPAKAFPEGTRIIQLYDRADGELLILGEPGAGKTTFLLDITRELLERASQNEAHPLPVVLNLSSWSKKHAGLRDWVIEELNAKYQVPVQLARAWVEQEQLLLLLDGLDEIDADLRSNCIEAINTFRKEQGLVPMVVCSRTNDYFDQSHRLLLNQAVTIDPLTPQQIEAYLLHEGENLAALWAELQRDTIGLKELATTPLMLTILAITYHEQPQSEALLPATPLLLRYHVFEKYVESVLQRRSPKGNYHSHKTKRYLTWLARQIQEHNQTVFSLERLQPDWLPSSTIQRYRNWVIRLVFGIMFFIEGMLLACFRGDAQPTQPGLFSQLSGATGTRLFGWMALGIGGPLRPLTSLEIIMAVVMVLGNVLVSRGELPIFTVQSIKHGLKVVARDGGIIGGATGVFSIIVFSLEGGWAYGLARGIATGLFGALLVIASRGIPTFLQFQHEGAASHQQEKLPKRTFIDRLKNGGVFTVTTALGAGLVYLWQYQQLNTLVVVYALIVGVFVGIVMGLVNGIEVVPSPGIHITPAEIVKWSGTWRTFSAYLKKGALLGSLIMVFVGIAVAALSSFFHGIGYGLLYGLLFGLLVGINGGMKGIFSAFFANGWSSTLLEADQLLRPNEGIRRSFRNACIAASLFGCLGGLLSGLICSLVFGLANIPGWPMLGRGFAIVFGITFAYEFFAYHGGIACLEHYLLRYFLWRKGMVPWNYVAFLDYAAEHILLRRVGGSYMFSHRLLQEYFASLDSNATIPWHLL